MNRKERRARLGERDRSREGGDQARGVTPGERLDRHELAELREQRAEAYNAMTAVLDAAEREGRDLSHNQANEYDRHEADFDRLDARIKGAEARNQRDLDGADTRGTVAISGEPERRERRTLTLGREQRMVDWAAERDSRYNADDAEEFSLGRAVRGMVRGDWREADLERRALAEGTDATGGALVPEVLAASTIDRLRNAVQVIAAGAQVAPMGSDSVSIPKLTGGVVPAWRAENAPVAKDDPAFSKLTLVTKTLAVLTDLSWELVEDLTPQGAELIENELVQAIGLELDRAALYGDGSGNQPVGIKNTTGVTVEAIAADGATPTDYAAFIRGAFALRRANVKPLGFLYSERTAETLAGLTASDGQPLLPPPAISEVGHFPTGQVPNDLDQGTTLGAASDLFSGDWSRLIIGLRPQVGVRVVRNGTASMDTMSTQVVAFVRADIALAHPEAFHVTTGLLE